MESERYRKACIGVARDLSSILSTVWSKTEEDIQEASGHDFAVLAKSWQILAICQSIRLVPK